MTQKSSGANLKCKFTTPKKIDDSTLTYDRKSGTKLTKHTAITGKKRSIQIRSNYNKFR